MILLYQQNQRAFNHNLDVSLFLLKLVIRILASVMQLKSSTISLLLIALINDASSLECTFT